MWLFKKKQSPYANSAKVLSECGFSDEYIVALNADIAAAKKDKDINNGNCHLCNALIICGRLTEAYDVFLIINIDKLDKLIAPTLLHNVIFSLFARGKNKEADALYQDYNKIVLSEHTDSMRRTLAIHEHISGRYENAVTVYAKLLDSECRFIDFCLIKTMVKLDMFERAAEIMSALDAYKGLSELGNETEKLVKKINYGLRTGNKSYKKKRKG